MASPAQIIANRENAQLSTGPKTEAGKQASSRNSSRHGLTGAQIVMPGENAAAYEELREGLHFAHNPANDPERLLVDQIAANGWRLMRAQRVETAFLAKLAEGSDNPDGAIAAAFLERPKDLARIQRYVTAANNAYYKAMAELSKLQKERAAAERQTEINGILAGFSAAGWLRFVRRSFVSEKVTPERERRPQPGGTRSGSQARCVVRQPNPSMCPGAHRPLPCRA